MRILRLLHSVSGAAGVHFRRDEGTTAAGQLGWADCPRAAIAHASSGTNSQTAHQHSRARHNLICVKAFWEFRRAISWLCELFTQTFSRWLGKHALDCCLKCRPFGLRKGVCNIIAVYRHTSYIYRCGFAGELSSHYHSMGASSDVPHYVVQSPKLTKLTYRLRAVHGDNWPELALQEVANQVPPPLRLKS